MEELGIGIPGSSISGGQFSRGRWRSLKEERYAEDRRKELAAAQRSAAARVAQDQAAAAHRAATVARRTSEDAAARAGTFYRLISGTPQIGQIDLGRHAALLQATQAQQRAREEAAEEAAVIKLLLEGH